MMKDDHSSFILHTSKKPSRPWCFYIGVTDNEWFRFLRTRQRDEVNFWQPSGFRKFRVLQPGEPFLFKLHSPENYIVGGGFFAHFSILPATLAWEAFREKNGAASWNAMRRRIEKYRRTGSQPYSDYDIGCIVLTDPFFWDESNWIPAPSDFQRSIVQGKHYTLQDRIGENLWAEIRSRLEYPLPEEVASTGTKDTPSYPYPPVVADVSGTPAHSILFDGPMFGEPALVRPRLGQGAFRVIVTDTYERRCAVTGEKVLPVLEAAHIKPVSEAGRHEVPNGLLLRSDLHRLFDRGYVTVTPNYRLRVSRRLRDDFHNGEEYFHLADRELWVPDDPNLRPRREHLEWHGDTVFKG